MASDLFYPGMIVSLHRRAAQKLLRAGDGDAALLYLCLLAEEDTAKLGWPLDRLETARGRLAGLGLIDPAAPVSAPAPQKLEPEAPPDYTTADITMALRQEGGGFAGLVPAVERQLGKALSPSDLKTLYLLYDFLALPPEVILLLVGWCVQKEAQRAGPGRKPTLTQIKREAFRWQRAGVDSLDAADRHVARLSRLSERTQAICDLMDIRGRAPVRAEQRYLDAWAEMGFADDALRLAYEKTLMGAGKLSWAYMDKILRAWQQKGLFTAEAVAQGEGRRRAPQGSARTGGTAAAAAAMPSDDIGRLMAQTARKEDE